MTNEKTLKQRIDDIEDELNTFLKALRSKLATNVPFSLKQRELQRILDDTLANYAFLKSEATEQ